MNRRRQRKPGMYPSWAQAFTHLGFIVGASLMILYCVWALVT